jgi:hypothetical protein
VGMSFRVRSQSVPDTPVHALVILLITAVPYAVWRLQRVRSLAV